MTDVVKEQTGAENVLWDLGDLYKGMDDRAIERDFSDVTVNADNFAERYRGRVAALSAAELAQALTGLETLYQQFGRLANFASLQWTTDTNNPTFGALMQRSREVGSQVQQKLLFFDLEWANIPDDHIKITDDPALQRWRHYLLKLLDARPHLLSEAEEKILAEKAVTGIAAWTRYFTAVFVVLVLVTTLTLLAGSLNLPFKIPREDILAANLIAAANFFLLALRSARFYLLRMLGSSAALALVMPLEVRAATVGVVILLAVFALQRRWSTLVSLISIPVAILGLLAVANVQLPGRVGTSAADLVQRQFSVVPLLLEGKVAGTDPELPHDATYGTAVWRYNWWVALIHDTLASTDTTLVGVGFGADITGPLEVDQS